MLGVCQHAPSTSGSNCRVGRSGTENPRCSEHFASITENVNRNGCATPSAPVLEENLPPPAYEDIELGSRRKQSPRRRLQKLAIAFVVNCVMLCVAYLVYFIDWYANSFSCSHSTTSAVTVVTAVSSGFHAIQALVVAALFYFATCKNQKNPSVYGAIIAMASGLGVVYSLFSTTVILLALNFNFSSECLGPSSGRLFAGAWIVSVGSSLLEIIFLIRSVYICFRKIDRQPSENRSTRVYTIETPPSYFEQIPFPPKYTP